MKGDDRELGMGRAISRRDFVYGAAALTGAIGVAGQAGLALAASDSAAVYPPLRHGMRGFHPGSFEPVHALAWAGQSPPEGESTGEVYDLVVVGGGLSGLASAYFFRKQAGPKAKILVLDNLEGFGGHAQRNEFEYEGKRLIANGGSAYLVSPSDWSAEAKSIINDLEIAKGSPKDQTDGDLYRSRGMGGGVFFPKEVYGRDRLVKGDLSRPTPEFLAKTPMSARLRADLDKLMNGKTDYMAGMSSEQKIAALQSMSYRDYLLNVAKLSEEALFFTQGVWCLGNDMASAWFAFFRHKPGFEGLGLTRPDKSPEGAEARADDYTLPGGNSDVARLIVRSLIPDALPAGSFIDIADQRTDYTVLDRPSNATRIRQSSIVYNVRHLGAKPHLLEPDTREVLVSYLNGGKAYSVKAANVVLACMNNVSAFICPELPDVQKTALRTAVRAANQATNVMFRNWKAFEEAGLTGATAPNSFYGRMGLSSPRFFGPTTPSLSPSEPIIVSFSTGGNSGICANPTMLQALCGEATPEPGTPADDQFRAVRHGLLGAPFEVFERQVRDLSARVLRGTSFDPARDIVAITVNRWPHGFATGRNDLFDPPLEPGAFPPPVVARQPWGRIAIANTDAGGVSTMQTAFDQAFRAVNDLQQRDYGFYEHI
ncbi:NAD(P)-binding protein [Phenylobacterium sp.]|uniref:NAD(P)-binding protein n=1 Tax=Phenylobacterium sp. TaxID=1871053 RepID=UPI0035AF3940